MPPRKKFTVTLLSQTTTTEKTTTEYNSDGTRHSSTSTKRTTKTTLTHDAKRQKTFDGRVAVAVARELARAALNRKIAVATARELASTRARSAWTRVIQSVRFHVRVVARAARVREIDRVREIARAARITARRNQNRARNRAINCPHGCWPAPCISDKDLVVDSITRQLESVNGYPEIKNGVWSCNLVDIESRELPVTRCFKCMDNHETDCCARYTSPVHVTVRSTDEPFYLEGAHVRLSDWNQNSRSFRTTFVAPPPSPYSTLFPYQEEIVDLFNRQDLLNQRNRHHMSLGVGVNDNCNRRPSPRRTPRRPFPPIPPRPPGW